MADVGGMLALLLRGSALIVTFLESEKPFAIFASKAYKFPLDKKKTILSRNRNKEKLVFTEEEKIPLKDFIGWK